MSNGYYYVAEVQDNFIATLINKLQFFSSLVPCFSSRIFKHMGKLFPYCLGKRYTDTVPRNCKLVLPN